mmetsp:Transcript_47078/g.131294  ORF Transcript_47078/g.131294 Transcript_47078/m.131294 type:complete len:211 (-) Transcript_47078:21-653(-)
MRETQQFTDVRHRDAHGTNVKELEHSLECTPGKVEVDLCFLPTPRRPNPRSRRPRGRCCAVNCRGGTSLCGGWPPDTLREGAADEAGKRLARQGKHEAVRWENGAFPAAEPNVAKPAVAPKFGQTFQEAQLVGPRGMDLHTSRCAATSVDGTAADGASAAAARRIPGPSTATRALRPESDLFWAHRSLRSHGSASVDAARAAVATAVATR